MGLTGHNRARASTMSFARRLASLRYHHGNLKALLQPRNQHTLGSQSRSLKCCSQTRRVTMQDSSSSRVLRPPQTIDSTANSILRISKPIRPTPIPSTTGVAQTRTHSLDIILHYSIGGKIILSHSIYTFNFIGCIYFTVYLVNSFSSN